MDRRKGAARLSGWTGSGDRPARLGPPPFGPLLLAGIGDPHPLLTDPAQGLSRALGRQGTEERFESFGEGLQQKMRAAFLALAEEFPARFRRIDGNRGIEAVARDVLALAATELA